MKKWFSSSSSTHLSDFTQIICLEVSSIFRISGASFERERYSWTKVVHKRAGRSARIKISSVSNREVLGSNERGTKGRRATKMNKLTTRIEELNSPRPSLKYTESSFCVQKKISIFLDLYFEISIICVQIISVNFLM